MCCHLVSTINSWHRKWQNFPFYNIKRMLLTELALHNPSNNKNCCIVHLVKKILPSHSAQQLNSQQHRGHNLLWHTCKLHKVLDNSYYSSTSLLSAFHSFSLLYNTSMGTVSGLSCFPVVKHYLHIPQQGVGRCRAWWLKTPCHCIACIPVPGSCWP